MQALRSRFPLLVLVALLLGNSHAAVDEERRALEHRAEQLAAAISSHPVWPRDLFETRFVRLIAPYALRDRFTALHATHGRAVSVSFVRSLPKSPRSLGARFEIALNDGMVMELDLRIAPRPPHRVVYLWGYRPVPGFGELEDGALLLSRLPGSVALTVCRLGGKTPRVLVSMNGNKPLAVASAMKLYILGALASEIQQGKRKWSDIVLLDPKWRSAGTGVARRWPDGSPVTIHTLALLMTTLSDNTAADHLLGVLGRRNVEKSLVAMGNHHADRNTPLLSTAEWFKLLWSDLGKHADAYLARDTNGRREYLEKVVAQVPLDFDWPWKMRPNRFREVGWFASTHDLCVAMDRLRLGSEAGPAGRLRDVLAAGRLSQLPTHAFDYQSYKGGRATGIVNHTFLVRTRKKSWFALSLTWNDAKAPLNENRAEPVLLRLLQLLARR